MLYSPTEASHVDATALITHDAALYEGDHGPLGDVGDNPLGAIQNIFTSDGDNNGTGLGVGNDACGAGANAGIHFMMRITLPDAPRTSASGDIISDNNTEIKKVVLKFNVHSITAGTSNTRVAFAPIIRAPTAIDYSAVCWNSSDGSTDWAAGGAKSTGDRDDTTDYGSGVAGVAALPSLTTGWNAVTLQDSMTVGPSSAQLVGFNWGSTIDIICFPMNPTDLDVTGNAARIYSLETAGSSALIAKRPYVEVYYEDDLPSKPIIQATPGDDFRSCKISLVNQPQEKDLIQYVASWRQGGTPTYETGSSDPSYGKVLTDVNKEYYDNFLDLFNSGSGSTLFFPGGSSPTGTTNELLFWAEDNNNTGSTGATKGNKLSITRYQPYVCEDPDASNFADSSSFSWIVIGKATAGSGASSLTDTTNGTTEPWLRGNFVTNDVKVGDKVYNIGDRNGSTPSSGDITAVTETTVTASTMTGGTNNNWDSGDEYVIVKKVNVGDKVSMTVRSTRVDGLQFDKIGIWWTNTYNDHLGDDINIDLSSFDIIELDKPTTKHTISFRYTEAGAYYPQYFFVDSATGFRTGVRQAGRHTDPSSVAYALDAGAVPVVTVVQPDPVPKLTSSKSVGESANVGLDRSSAVIYSAANSTASGANAYVKNYQWLGEFVSGQILTQGCLDIDNTSLINESKKVYMRCNTAAYNDTVFTIYGLASFEADNETPVKDTGITFSHYRYVKATVSPGSAKYLVHNTVNGFGNAARTDPTAPDTEVFFKQVDFIYATTKSVTAGSEECYQLLAADSDNSGEAAAVDAVDAAGTLDINTICKRLCIDSNNGSPGYKWGGLITTTGSATFAKNSGADTITGIDWIAAGFGPGDTITIENTSNDGVYTVQKIETTGGPVHTMYLNEELALGETATATIFTTQPTISVASSAAGTGKISLNVTDNLGVTADAAINLYTTFRDQTYLDLNASADSGIFAIQTASLSRSGGMSAAMPLGERRYPPDAVHTKHGLPKMTMTVRVINSTGFNRMYRLLNNSYNYAVYQHHDTSFASWVKYRLKLESFTVNRDPQNLQHQVVNLSFFIVGEEV